MSVIFIGPAEQLGVLQGVGWAVVCCPIFDCLRFDVRSTNDRTVDALIQMAVAHHEINCIGREHTR